MRRQKIMLKNILGEELQVCCENSLRCGCCNTSLDTNNVRTICTVMTKEFLEFHRSRGNTLDAAVGETVCLCIFDWGDAYLAGYAPPIKTKATHEVILEYFPLVVLEKYKVEY